MVGKWLDAQRRHFDSRLSTYADMYTADTPFHRAMTERLLQFAGPRPGEEALDLGCGVGRVTLPLLRAGCRVTGVDLSAPTLDFLRGRVQEAGFTERFRAECRPVEELEYKRQFHLVVGRGILHHLEDPAAMMRRVSRALIPGGRAVFMDPNPWHPGWIPFILLHPALSWSVERRVLRGRPARTLRLLRDAGLVNVGCAFAGLLPPPLWGLLPGAGGLERKLAAVPGLGRLALYLQVRGFRRKDG